MHDNIQSLSPVGGGRILAGRGRNEVLVVRVESSSLLFVRARCAPIDACEVPATYVVQVLRVWRVTVRSDGRARSRLTNSCSAADMHPLIPKLGSDIRDIACHEALQEGQELIKLLVAKIMVPSTNMDAIIWLCHEVLLDIIDDNCLL